MTPRRTRAEVTLTANTNGWRRLYDVTGPASARDRAQQSEMPSTSRSPIGIGADPPSVRFRLAPRSHCISTPASIPGGCDRIFPLFSHLERTAGHTTARPSSTGDCPARGCGRRGSPSASAPDGIGCALSAPRAPANPRPRSGTSAGSGRCCRPGRSLCAALVSDGTLATCSLRIPAFCSSPEGLIADFSTGTGQRCPWCSCFPEPRGPLRRSGARLLCEARDPEKASDTTRTENEHDAHGNHEAHRSHGVIDDA